ncbi:SGM1 (YJR134C) [Zygosaccharomyces parabailii]|uniref:ZYBA0S10-04324g1_1 n=1 Tax=Zygosaccharomyces bailii (strain CLIB 213 / ATCC 58445 / CBS 680 / BCRC 21525 / NBRC 1098 / NCYC 1416 / NRRL Y-2227) TaxID=1333698 RepID=A0A8J2TAA2_ZYGB2|nr:SGM1 (YJR134C) [Zygosaccharomyces parabailii]CDF91305.1 ZYBA0S10-04324g1_1 [Zygosaccharomyces bailii CLIB 213]CDH17074.1 uncharacterized protein ZBAI_08862 [Zygosaccharomyces bailii ISA1307]
MSETKKLSLEERLSLAARKNRKRGKRASPVPTSLSAVSGTIEEANLRAESDEKVIKNADKNAKENQVDPNKSQSPTLEAESVSLDTTDPILVATGNAHEAQHTKQETQIVQLNSLRNVAPWSFFLPTNTKVSSIDDFLDILRPAVQLMYDESEQMKKKIAATNKNEESREDEFMKEKDELINQLRYEGEKLASKELRQNNAIKAFKKKICGMENDMNILKEELSKKISAFENITLSYEELQSQVQEREVKMRELCKENERLKDLEAALNKGEAEIFSLRSSLQESRKNAIEQEGILNGEIEALKFSSEEQVTNLEAALEHLRIELDQTSRKTTTATITSSNEHLLSQELEKCKCNWSKLENTLNDKISEMETHIHNLEESKRELENQLISSQQLNNSLESKMLKERQEKENNSTTYYNLKQETEKLRKQLQDTTEDYQLLQKKYEIQHLQLELNIGSSEKGVGKSGRSMDAASTRKEEVITSAEMDDDWMYPPNMSQISPMESSIGFENSSLRKEVDELSDHAPIEDGDDKLSTTGIDIPDEAAALGSSTNGMSLTPKNTNSMGYQRRSAQVEVSGKMNAHMISKLGAEVRRYEAELVSLQNTCDRLQKEKNEASDEILKLLEENDKVQKLTKERDEIIEKLEESQNRLDVTFHLLGEKTEQVEELENDVLDLKEMIRQQVQQFVELQEKML